MDKRNNVGRDPDWYVDQNGILTFANPYHDPTTGRFTDGPAGKVIKDLKETGGAGATVNPRSVRSVTEGVAVGGVLDTIELPSGDLNTPEGEAKAKKALTEYLKEANKRGVFDHDDIMIGAWQDDRGNLVVEPAQIIRDVEHAKEVGKVRNQEGVFDTGRGEFHGTEGTGKFIPGNSPLQKVGQGSTWRYQRKKTVRGVTE